MERAEKLASVEPDALSWGEICVRYPNEWVCLLDVESAREGSILSARVIGHDSSMRSVLAQVGITRAGATIVHTAGRLLRFPRLEMTDEIRDIVRAQR